MEMKMKSSSLTKEAVGICLGATTFTLVELKEENNQITINNKIIQEHEGDPKSIFSKVVSQYNLEDKYVGVTGRKFRRILNFSSIIEPEAVEYAYDFVNQKQISYDAIVSAGGETFMVYEIDKKGKISRISSGNKCASGTGEFFMQQIKRMNIDVEEAIELSKTSETPHHLSGRCSVFCKSDCTHALNKGESIADVTAGLAKMIAKKIEELLIKINAKKIMVVGGTAQNQVVIDFLKENFETVYVPNEAPFFEALGSAIWALKAKHAQVPKKDQYYKKQKSSFEFLKPLKSYQHLVEFKELPYQNPESGDECIIGLDVGSTTTKAVLLRTRDEKILKSIYLRTNGSPVEASRKCYQSLLEQLNNVSVKITGLGVTGSGRYIAGLHADSEGIINEIIAHARASAHFDAEVDTIYEIGGQDAKYTYLTNSVASDYAMNEACSAGTGSFLEESAYEQLGVKMEEIADIALKAQNPPNFSDQCSAFISSDINTAFQEGISREDIIAGLVYSICINYINRVKGSRTTGNKVFMQGGVCYNRAIPIAMAGLIGKKIIVPPQPGLMGAYGVALEIKNLIQLGLLKEKDFNLKTLADRKVEYGKPFVCMGTAEKCDRRCVINMIQIEGKKIPFGGACNKYYNLKNKIKVDIKKHNHIERRTELLYQEWENAPRKEKEDQPIIGINASFQINTLLPMFFTFFNELGCKVIMSDEVHTDAIDKGMTSFCLSAQIALGLFDNLLSKKPDYIFMPQIMEMHVSSQKEYRKEYQTVCMFVQGEPFYQKATFLKEMKNPPKMLTPALNFMRGFDAEAETFTKMASDLGFSESAATQAYHKAVNKQLEFFKNMKKEGQRVLAELEKDPSKTAIVLFGRPYNAFDDKTNKGVPFKFASRGIEIIPYDYLMYEQEENFRDTYWEMGQRIIKAARIVERHPQLYGCYLTNFLCALDSMMVPHFRDLMGIKPSLTIEVDTHTADAGVNTRIEAFMDVVKNYQKMKQNLEVTPSTFTQAKAIIDQKGTAWYIDSQGEKFSFKDPRVKVIIPSMGDLFNSAGAAALNAQGWHAEGLPVCDREALDLGRSVTTSKECLPIINIIGELLKYLKYRKNPNEKLALFLVSAGGCCRVGQYHILTKTIIDKLKLKDVAVITLANDDGYAGLGISFRLNIAKLLYAGDVFDDIRSVIKAMAVDKEEGLKIFYEEWDKLLGSIDGRNKKKFYPQLKQSAARLGTIKLVKPIEEAKYIGVVGEIFVRRDHFSLMSIPERLAEEGFVMLDAPVMEWNRYVDFLKQTGMFEAQTNFVGKLEELISDWVQDYHEKRIKNILATTGLYEFEMIDIKKYMAHSAHIFPYTLTGEPGLSTGASLYHMIDKYCGTINVGPFGCMNSRMTEAVTTFEMTLEGKMEAAKLAGNEKDYSFLKDQLDILPFLSIECDGNPFSQILEARFETFMLQANRLHELMKNQKEKN
ncbi:MAG: acyl-CoA dehydratase activase [Spirochaetes bacterium]|nr:acyl-CoA dehydratase activase [Spirochaetota bacterium]